MRMRGTHDHRAFQHTYCYLRRSPLCVRVWHHRVRVSTIINKRSHTSVGRSPTRFPIRRARQRALEDAAADAPRSVKRVTIDQQPTRNMLHCVRITMARASVDGVGPEGSSARVSPIIHTLRSPRRYRSGGGCCCSRGAGDRRRTMRTVEAGLSHGRCDCGDGGRGDGDRRRGRRMTGRHRRLQLLATGRHVTAD